MQAPATVVPPTARGRGGAARRRRGLRRAAEHSCRCAISTSSTARSRRSSTTPSRSRQNRVTAVIGPSGCGKSTHIRTYNRIYNLYRDQRASGEIAVRRRATSCRRQTDLLDLRRRIGMIFQKPSPFPMTVFDNVAYGLRQHYQHRPRRAVATASRTRCKRSALWDEVKHKLNEPGNALSRRPAAAPVHRPRHRRRARRAAHGRALLGHRPRRHGEDRGAHPRAQAHTYTIVLVTHNMQQAARVSDYTAFFFQGRIVEFGADARRSSRTPRRSRPRSTSPAASAETRATHDASAARDRQAQAQDPGAGRPGGGEPAPGLPGHRAARRRRWRAR